MTWLHASSFLRAPNDNNILNSEPENIFGAFWYIGVKCFSGVSLILVICFLHFKHLINNSKQMRNVMLLSTNSKWEAVFRAHTCCCCRRPHAPCRRCGFSPTAPSACFVYLLAPDTWGGGEEGWRGEGRGGGLAQRRFPMSFLDYNKQKSDREKSVDGRSVLHLLVLLGQYQHLSALSPSIQHRRRSSMSLSGSQTPEDGLYGEWRRYMAQAAVFLLHQLIYLFHSHDVMFYAYMQLLNS